MADHKKSMGKDTNSNKTIFHEPWWINTLAGDNEWGYAEIFENKKCIASLPWIKIKNKIGKEIICQPAWTQSFGPWISAPGKNISYANEISRQHSLMDKLIDKLPSFDHFIQSFTPEITNALPFYWRGYDIKLCYTYRLFNLHETDKLWESMRSQVRNKITKAKKLGIIVEESNDIASFYKLLEKTYSRQNLQVNESRELLKKLYFSCIKNNSGCLFLAKDKNNNLHSGMFLVYNEYCAYNLIAGADPEFRNSGAHSLTMWNAINFAKDKSKIFDMEGSMIKSIETFFRGFGAIQVPYVQVQKTESKLLKIIKMSKSIFF
mgnify:CR=1 FL=1